LALTRVDDGRRLQSLSATVLKAGGYAYVLAVCAMAGAYGRETLAGRMEWNWIVFGPCVLAALIALDYGLYRKLIKANIATWRRYRPYITRENADPGSMRRVLIDDVLLHRALYRTSKIRWLRHTLIFWGFTAMFVTELVAVFVRDGFPAFGWRDIWREPSHPVRLVFAFIYDFTGLMILLGCLIALAWRAAVNRAPERKFSDTPTTIFLLFVVATGFWVEGLRIAPTLGDGSHAAAFAGVMTARALVATGLALPAYESPLWMIHVLAACAFIGYVPVMRLIHSCATPLGRLMNSQRTMLAAKKHGVLSAMLRSRGVAHELRKSEVR
jgi:nitrate reductase gamma subunit